MRKGDGLTTILVVIVLGLTALTLLYYVAVFFYPNTPFNPLSPQRATQMAQARLPTAVVIQTPTLDPSYPATWTPVPTGTPPPTKTPTETRTPTPTRTNTPTDTPTPTRTPTPLPPTLPPPPTATSTPPLFYVSSYRGENNCANMGLRGVVTGPDGLPAAGITVKYGELETPNSEFVATTDANGRYSALLLPGSNRAAVSRAHNWYTYIEYNGKPLSEVFKFTTDPIYANNPSYCDDDDNNNNNNNGNDNNANGNDNNSNGNNNNNGNDNDNDNNNNNTSLDDDELPPGCLLDPCQVSHSTQIKVVNWQFRSGIAY